MRICHTHTPGDAQDTALTLLSTQQPNIHVHDSPRSVGEASVEGGAMSGPHLVVFSGGTAWNSVAGVCCSCVARGCVQRFVRLQMSSLHFIYT